MANETNKNRDDRKEKVDKPTSDESTKTPTGKAPLYGDYSNEDEETDDIPGSVTRGGGRRGNISTEDGGTVSGSSSGSH
ncbi:hypothetical protein TH63_06010 [Rufibacter radiotolerans]|uniref:Uncharacterized protein n=1 Tax=Rufibacter radiotolerans TaxID=1379910 RepID=A0A0H4W4E5_9BACT|nr:hypothetical protein [Rufibacter radiotolerans]AKQ45291.1 hypothetical protein TH63_06010 [Rufibacter radiotolerans]